MVITSIYAGCSKYSFNRSDLKCGTYGGKETDETKIEKTPIIFIHGNGDLGFANGIFDGYVLTQTGFKELITFLTENGYHKS